MGPAWEYFIGALWNLSQTQLMMSLWKTQLYWPQFLFFRWKLSSLDLPIYSLVSQSNRSEMEI